MTILTIKRLGMAAFSSLLFSVAFVSPAAAFDLFNHNDSGAQTHPYSFAPAVEVKHFNVDFMTANQQTKAANQANLKKFIVARVQQTSAAAAEALVAAKKSQVARHAGVASAPPVIAAGSAGEPAEPVQVATPTPAAPVPAAAPSLFNQPGGATAAGPIFGVQ